MDEYVSGLGSRNDRLWNPRIRTTDPQHLSKANHTEIRKRERGGTWKLLVQALRRTPREGREKTMETNLRRLWLGRLFEEGRIRFEYRLSPLDIVLQQGLQD